MTPRVLTGFSNLDDGELDIEAANAVTGLTDNDNFTFTGTDLTGFTKASGTYHASLSALKTGGQAATVAKNEAREALLPLFTAVAIIVNQQAKGNLTALLSSGIKLAAAHEHHQQPSPVNLQVANGANGSMIVSVKHSPVGDHGTVFAFTQDAKSTDPSTWTQKSVNAHKATITGLTPATSYEFTAAYKGTDDEPLIWAPPISKIVSN